MRSRWFAPLLLAAAVAGWALATVFPGVEWLHAATRLVQDGFLAALRMIIAPLIFFSLLSGVMQLRESGRMGRLGAVTVLFYLATSALAICLGLFIVFFIHPWTAYPPIVDAPTVVASPTFIDPAAGGVAEMLHGVLQKMIVNPFTALAELNILGILTTALLFGMAAAWTLPEGSQWPVLLNQLTQAIYTCATWVLSLLPLGLFAIAFQLTEQIEFHTLKSLGHFALVVFGATAVHGLLVLPLLGWWLGGTAPSKFLAAASQPMLTAFLTSSSAATLPLSMATAEERLGVDRNKAAFVLPLGATINMDGTALFEGVAVIFLAYMFNVPLSTPAIVLVFFVTMLASAGAPGIPSGSMAGLQTVLLAVGIPLEAIALLLLIERPLDTFRTAVNVEGDLVGATVAQRWS